VVKAVDNAQGTVTLAHDPIKSINWPSMTMEFKVRDKTLLVTVEDRLHVSTSRWKRSAMTTSSRA
jgi:Cu/Ag efflux protein CusF